jgi:DNA-binding NarL/FixJ family response regulator
MAILIYSQNGSLRQKWHTALKDQWQIYQASSIKELFVLLGRLPIETLLLHRGSVSSNELGELCRQRGSSKVFVLSDRPDDREGLACLRLGSVGYANSYITPLRLKAAIEAVQSGLVWVGTALMQYLIKGLGTGEDNDTATPAKIDETAEILLAGLSNRELQIAGLVAEGMHNNEIGDQLEISERTVKAHLSSIYAKTKTKGRLSLALLLKKGV